MSPRKRSAMYLAQIPALVFGIGGFGALIAATASNEWRVTTRASSVITATWVYQGLWMNCAGNALGSFHCRPHFTLFKVEVEDLRPGPWLSVLATVLSLLVPAGQLILPLLLKPGPQTCPFALAADAWLPGSGSVLWLAYHLMIPACLATQSRPKSLLGYPTFSASLVLLPHQNVLNSHSVPWEELLEHVSKL